MRAPKRPTRALVALVASVAVLLTVVIPGFAFPAGFTKADGGHVIVVRNGGPLDDNSIRQMIQPNSSLTSRSSTSPPRTARSWAWRAPSTSTSTTPTKR
jgi:hypothetical protein